VSFRLPLLDWLPGYRKEWLGPDVIAGLSAAAVVIPVAMAHSSIAGLPVQVGLYTALVPMVIYALLGTSRPLSVSTTSTIAILTGAQLALVVPGGAAADLFRATATLAMLVGLLLLAAWVLRLGFVADFISEPVLIGFKAGIGLVIVLDQIPKLIGVHITKAGFLHNFVATIRAAPEASLPTVIVGALTIGLLVAFKKFAPKLPAPLIVVALGIAAMSVFGLDGYGVRTVGEIPRGLPSLMLPDFSLMSALLPGALGIVLVSFTETVASARAFAMPGEPAIKPNRELLATGLGNVAGSLFGAMASGGGTSQTAVNRRSGARTQLAELITAGGTLVTLLFLAGLVSAMPNATLAAVVITSAIGLIKPAEFRAISRIRRMEFLWALGSVAGVVLLGTLNGILVAVVLSLVGLVQQAASPPLYVLGRKPETNVFRPSSTEHPEDETFPGLLIIRTEGRIFFANAPGLWARIRELVEKANPRVLAFDMSGVFDLEYSALKAMVESEPRLRDHGTELWLVGLAPGVLEVIQRSALGSVLDRERMHFNLETAVGKYQARFSTAP
jgi:high affinity sulfate transporter 1